MHDADDGFELFLTLTRAQPPNWDSYSRRIDREMLVEVMGRFGETPRAYICGPTLLMEAVAETLVLLGLPSDHIRTERFSPTGGT